MTAFTVPSDLAQLDLTMKQVIDVIANRRRQKTLENRIASHPAKLKTLQDELEEVVAKEAKLLEAADG